jgi:hypothetical protein
LAPAFEDSGTGMLSALLVGQASFSMLGQSPRYRIAPMSRVRDGVDLYSASGTHSVAPGAFLRQIIFDLEFWSRYNLLS